MATSYDSGLQQWALPQLSHLLPLSEDELKSIIDYVEPLPDSETQEHLQGLLGDSPEANQFLAQFIERREYFRASARKQMSDEKSLAGPGASVANGGSSSADPVSASIPTVQQNAPPAYVPPLGPPPVNGGGVRTARNHTNPVIEAARVRAKDEVRYLNSPEDS